MNGPPDPQLVVQLALIFDVVHNGGSFTVQGSYPMPQDPPIAPRYQARLASPTGARYAGGEGETLVECLEQLLLRWSKV